MSVNKNAFILRLDTRLNSARQESIVGIGWCKARELNKADSREQFKDIVRNAYPEYYTSSERALGSACGSMWRFIKEAKAGDLVVIPVKKSFYVAEITGDILYDKNGCEEDFAWRRSVRWLTDKPILRSYASNPLQMRIKSRQTCVDATDLLESIEAACKQEKPLELVDVLLTSAASVVSDALFQAINDSGLERVIKRLAIANGATTAIIPPKNSKLTGDVDVLATYDLKVGNEHSKQVKIAYQVKQHKGITDEAGVIQLIDRMKIDDDIVSGCLVTTAESISEKAKELVAAHDEIIVITRKELVEWVLRAGLSALSVDDEASYKFAA